MITPNDDVSRHTAAETQAMFVPLILLAAIVIHHVDVYCTTVGPNGPWRKINGSVPDPRENVPADGRYFYLFTNDWYMGVGGTLPNQCTDAFFLQTRE